MPDALDRTGALAVTGIVRVKARRMDGVPGCGKRRPRLAGLTRRGDAKVRGSVRLRASLHFLEAGGGLLHVRREFIEFLHLAHFDDFIA